MRQNSTVRKKRVTRPNYGRPAARARDTTAPVSFPGLIFPLEIFLRTRSRRVSGELKRSTTA